MTPLERTIMRSAFLTVESLCAMTKVVRPSMRFVSAFCTSCSLSVSRELVASSSMSIGAFLNIALAIESLCLSPPESLTPPSPMRVSYPSGSLDMKPCALAALAARSICSPVASAAP